MKIQVNLNNETEQPIEKVEEKVKNDLDKDIDFILSQNANQQKEDKIDYFEDQKEDDEEQPIKKKTNKRLETQNSISNEDYYNNYKIRMKNNRLKKYAITGAFLFFIISITILNIYFIFFREVKSTPEIANEVINQAAIYSFPKEGVQKFLEDNIKEILEENKIRNTAEGAENCNTEKLSVNRISAVSNSEASVYFSVVISNNLGKSEHYFMIPLEYDYDTKSYKPSGELCISGREDQSNSKIDTDFNSFLSFGDIKKYDEDETKKLQTFLDNFYVILYNQKNSVSSYYDGAKLSTNNLTYNKINEVEYYIDKNPADVNVKVNYNVTTSEGISYDITSYIEVEQVNKTYMIHFIY